MCYGVTSVALSFGERMEQLTWIKENSEEKYYKELKSLKEQCEKVRKSQFAKIGHLTKLVNDLQFEMDCIRHTTGQMHLATPGNIYDDSRRSTSNDYL